MNIFSVYREKKRKTIFTGLKKFYKFQVSRIVRFNSKLKICLVILAILPTEIPKLFFKLELYLANFIKDFKFYFQNSCKNPIKRSTNY